VQRHYRNARCFGGLLRIAKLYHICDMYTIFTLPCKAFCFGHLSPANWPAFTVGGAGQLLAGCAASRNHMPQIFALVIEAAKLGRIATHSLEAETLRAKTQRKHAAALAAWKPSELPEWLNEDAYRTKIQPALAVITVPAIATALGVSGPYATDIRRGRRIPHPRHWVALAQLVGVSLND
jgi:hypothetical protein